MEKKTAIVAVLAVALVAVVVAVLMTASEDGGPTCPMQRMSR